MYKMQLLGFEGVLTSGFLLVLPLLILFVLIKILPPWPDVEAHLEHTPAKTA